MNLTVDEQHILAIFNTGRRESTMKHLTEMLPDLDPDETELSGMVESSVEKLRSMTDDEFQELHLQPEFDE